jgi:hypothetical protein
VSRSSFFNLPVEFACFGFVKASGLHPRGLAGYRIGLALLALDLGPSRRIRRGFVAAVASDTEALPVRRIVGATHPESDDVV